MMKWIGALLVLAACGTTGFRGAAEYLRQLQDFRSLISVLDMMECELSYNLTPLPELCRKSASFGSKRVRSVFRTLAQTLERQPYYDVMGGMSWVLQQNKDSSKRLSRMLENLGNCLGRFDLSGQLAGLASVREQCIQELSILEKNREQRTRSFQTLGLCAGAALVILFI